MNAYSIEDKIIAYFDGRLNDADGAELLHRVSVSPEIRQIFEDHAALREMAVRAAQQTTIAPELEESLFRRIEEMRHEEKLPVGFWNFRRLSVTAGALAIILLGVVNAIEIRNLDMRIAQIPLKSVATVSTGFNTAHSSFEAAKTSTVPFVVDKVKAQPVLSVAQNVKSGSEPAIPQESDIQPTPDAISMRPVPHTAEVASIPGWTPEPATLLSLRNVDEHDVSSRFEFGLASPMSSFVYASPLTPPLFSDVSASAAYKFNEQNQVGIKVTYGSFIGLSAGRSSQQGYTLITSQMQKQSASTEELFYQHREPISGGLFFVTTGVGGGIYTLNQLGNVLSAELGIELPISNRMLGGISFVVDRLQQGGSMSQILSSSSEPVIFAGSNQYRTLAGHIEYALTYKF